MKKIIILSVLVFIAIVGFFLIKRGNKTNNLSGLEDIYNTPQIKGTYKVKYYIKEIGNGNYYDFLITTYDDGKTTSNFIMGCDLKPDDTELKIPTSLMDKDTSRIEEYFNKKQFKKEITIDDLNDLELGNFSKEDVVEMYNKAIIKDFDESVSGLGIKYCSFKQDKVKDGYKVYMGLLAERLGLEVLRIDIVYDNDIFLSDLVADKIASKEQITLYNNLKEIGNYVVKNQEFEVEDKFDFNGSVYDRVYKMISTIDDNKEKVENDEDDY